MKKLSTYKFTTPATSASPSNPGLFEIVANTHQDIKVDYFNYTAHNLWEKMIRLATFSHKKVVKETLDFLVYND